MAEERVERRLAAILAADVVGYSRLIEQDEEDTRARLRGLHTELIDPRIAADGGRIVKSAGDGVLVEFASVVDAVRNALAIQTAIASRNEDVPEERKIVFRVGINVGDVIVEGDDIHGDGVNVAARLEGLCGPGEIYVSGAVHDQVANKLSVDFDDLGEQTVKNISRPIRVFRVGVGSGASVETAAVAPPEDRPSVAVLPFDNMSGDAEQEYFSDGISEDIITDLSKISGLFVIARNSSFSYKGTSPDVRKVARELGVRYILEGSVRKAANRVRITAQMVDGATGGHLWAERYDRNLEDIFAVQDEITRTIVDALKVELDLEERSQLGNPATTNIEAYDLTLRGRSLLYSHTREENAEAKGLFEQAIALDPDQISAYWGLSVALFTAYTNGWDDATEETLEHGISIAKQAIEIAPADPQGHWVLALGELWKQNLDGALSAINAAVALAPNHAEVYATRGYILSFAGQSAEAMENLAKSMRLDPQFPTIWLHFLAHAHFIAGDYDEAAALLKRRIRRQPDTDISRGLLVSCYGHLGLVSEAKEEWARLLEVNPDYSIDRKGRVLPYRNPADWDRIVDGFRKAGVSA